MDTIKNENIKKLIKKVRRRKLINVEMDLRNSLLVELLFADLIIPASDVSDEFFTFKFIETDDMKDNFPVFTDLEAYNKVYGKDDSVEPIIFNLLQFENNIYSNLAYMVVNKSFKIEMDEIWYTIGYERSYRLKRKDFLHEFTLPECQQLTEIYDNSEINDYLNERRHIQSYYSLLDVLKNSVLFTEVLLTQDVNTPVSAKDVNPSFNFQDKYIVTYTNLKDANLKYFTIVDFINLVGFIIEKQLEGIKIDTGIKQIKLPRYQLLKHYWEILDYFEDFNLNHSFEFIFKNNY